MTLHMGDTVIELKFLGVGHTGGDIVVYLPKEKVLFSGDLFIKGSGLPDYRDDSNIDMLIESLRKMQGLDIDKIICGHMGIAEKKDIQASIDKLISFRKQVKKYVDENVPPEEAAQLIQFPEGENPFYKQHFKKVIQKVYNDIKNAQR
jgi:glyoxylase-like metal-dependent hydrolase (beta-lactamase superfamily II)